MEIKFRKDFRANLYQKTRIDEGEGVAVVSTRERTLLVGEGDAVVNFFRGFCQSCGEQGEIELRNRGGVLVEGVCLVGGVEESKGLCRVPGMLVPLEKSGDEDEMTEKEVEELPVWDSVLLYRQPGLETVKKKRG